VDNQKICNICGWKGEQFNVLYNERMRQNEECICPSCGSLARQRALFKYLQEKKDVKSSGSISFLIGKHTYISFLSVINRKLHEHKKCLDFLARYLYAIKEKNTLCLEIAPSLSPVKRVLKGVIYVSIDLKDPCAMFKMDLTALIFKDFTFNLVICSHVLEHIKEDFIAIEEIYRVLKKNGIGIFQIPIGYYDDPFGKHTIEFGNKRFYEHVRSYGQDFSERLTKVGLKVDIIRFSDNISSRLGIEKEVIFQCKK